ncbi:MAG: MarR family transcriptional regulator [Chloroflexi bacterium]|nr:MAG: MarR family transcriptional regulator [Chloroflexota bacterium]
MPSRSEKAALQTLEVTPLVMRAIRTHMRAHRAELTVTQFRALVFVDRHAGASLSDLGAHIGLSLSAMSKLVDALVERKLVARELDAIDRRRITLTLTARGRSILAQARRATHAALTKTFAPLKPRELDQIDAAMETLRRVFLSERPSRATKRDNHERS